MFVDCVSLGLFEKEPEKHCLYAYPPSSLGGFTYLVELAAKDIVPDFIVIDSISQFITLNPISDGNTAFSELAQTLKSIPGKTSARLIALYDDYVKIRNLPKLYIDPIVRIEIIKDKIDWRD